jgi:monofunctional biosynthetic peptidoglycan transglycosylase
MKRIFLLALAGLTFLISIIAVTALYIYTSLPDVRLMKGCLTTEMFHVQLCPQSSTYARLNQISPNLKHAILLSEDAGFYSHHGFDWDSIESSAEKDWREHKFARGGSTITQQLVKNVFLSKDKTIVRKIREFILTYRVEQNFKKDEILEKYLNVVQFGKNLFGARAGAKFYFQKDPGSLNVVESAFLAMLLPNPEKYSTSYHKGQLTRYARSRIVDLTRKLHSVGRIDDAEFDQAIAMLDQFPWNQVVESKAGDPSLEDFDQAVDGGGDVEDDPIQ